MKPAAIMNRTKARDLMAQHGLDAIIAYGGPNFFYMTGFQNYFDNPAAAFAVLPATDTGADFVIVANWVAEAAREAAETSAVISFPLWLEIGDMEGFRAGTLAPTTKPLRYDTEANIKLFAAGLAERGLHRGRIGIELANIAAPVFASLKQHLPEVEWVNAADLFFDLRSIKTSFEIACLRDATRITEHGMKALADTPLLGRDTAALKLIYEKACVELALSEPDTGFQGIRVTAAIGANISPTLSGGPKTAAGDLIFFDAGASVHGYGSDTGRTLVLAPPGAEALRIMDAVLAGMDAAMALIRPGARMCDIYHAGMAAVRAHPGMAWYSRGHIGHSMGLGMGEMPPFLAPGETRALQPGMVMALETPLYMRGLGGFQVEECFLVTETGYELITTLPRDFMPARA